MNRNKQASSRKRTRVPAPPSLLTVLTNVVLLQLRTSTVATGFLSGPSFISPLVARHDLSCHSLAISHNDKEDDRTASIRATTTRTNPTARAIFQTLSSRYGDLNRQTTPTGVSWKKTRNYVYQASGALSVPQVEQVLEFLETTFPDDSVLIENILTTAPRILRKDVDNQLRPTRDFLLQLYGDELFREAISRNPQLLLASGVSRGPRNEPLQSYLRQLGMKQGAIDKLQASAPFLFHLDTDKVQSVVGYLLELLGAGDEHPGSNAIRVVAHRKALIKIISGYPHLMNLSVGDNLQPRIQFLLQKCVLSDTQLASLIKSSPAILGLSVKDNLQPTLEFLWDLLRDPNMTEEDTVALVRKCVVKHPQLLALSLDNLNCKVDYFNGIDCLSGSDAGDETERTSLAARIAVRAPAVYSLSLPMNIIPKVEFLAKVWGVSGTSATIEDEEKETSLACMIREYPSVLTLSLEGNIQPTVNFFNRTGYIALDSEGNLQHNNSLPSNGHMLKSPPRIRGRYIATSLFNRLLPRWHYMVAKGWAELHEDAESSNLPPLHVVAAATDEVFCEQLGFNKQDYMHFKDESAPRLKFSSQFDTWLKTGRPIDETM